MLFLLPLVFLAGYLMIILEQPLRINKAASALLTAMICWVLVSFSTEASETASKSGEHLVQIAEILFFLMGAMTIVELVDAHDGFELVASFIRVKSLGKLVWIIGFCSFFLSAILDNLTTSIVMTSILGKVVDNKTTKWQLAGLVIIAANAGGAWSPIGDVTTTMLWIGGQVTTLQLIEHSFLPSLVCMLVPAGILSLRLKGELQKPTIIKLNKNFTSSAFHRNLVLATGIGCLLFVPIFKYLTHLPPYMGMLFGLGLMWVLTELLHSEKDEAEKGYLSVNHALRKIDTPSILFFLGILMAVAALETTGLLHQAAQSISSITKDVNIFTISIGGLSSIVDNVPLVAGIQGMYSIEQYPVDHNFWQMLAYCSGTGGSLLIIGSAAGVAVMGMEKIGFGWYLKNIAWLALAGYLAGALVFIFQHSLF